MLECPRQRFPHTPRPGTLPLLFIACRCTHAYGQSPLIVRLSLFVCNLNSHALLAIACEGGGGEEEELTTTIGGSCVLRPTPPALVVVSFLPSSRSNQLPPFARGFRLNAVCATSRWSWESFFLTLFRSDSCFNFSLCRNYYAFMNWYDSRWLDFYPGGWLYLLEDLQLLSSGEKWEGNVREFQENFCSVNFPVVSSVLFPLIWLSIDFNSVFFIDTCY